MCIRDSHSWIANETPIPETSLKLAAGAHKVELLERKGDALEIEVLVDDKPVLSLEKEDDWLPKNCGGSWSSSDVGNCRSFAAGAKVRLTHNKNGPNHVRAEQQNGILLWICDDEQN